jgi:hypothetical protein
LPNKRYFGLILICFLFSLVSCGENNSSDRTHAEFSFYTVGSGGISVRFGKQFYQVLDSLRGNTGQLDEFLFTIAEEPLTMNQILERSGLTPSQVELLIANLDSNNLIKKYSQNRWATTLPVITDNQMKIIRKDLAPMADSVAQYFKKEIHPIRTLYDEVKSPLDPPWEDISHLIISKFVIDGTFHSNLNRLKRESDASERDDSEVSVVPAFFLQKGGNNSNFGCNWYKFNEGDDQREVYVLHGAILDRYDIAMNKYRGDQHFSAALFNISPEGGIEYLTDREKEMLSDLDWISGDRLLVPIVKAGTIKSLQPAMENLGRDAAEVAFARFPDITDSYNKSTYSKFLDNDQDYIQVLIHSLFGLTIEYLVRSGTVSQTPETVPESFGVYIVFGKLF